MMKNYDVISNWLCITPCLARNFYVQLSQYITAKIADFIVCAFQRQEFQLCRCKDLRGRTLPVGKYKNKSVFKLPSSEHSGWILWSSLRSLTVPVPFFLVPL